MCGRVSLDASLSRTRNIIREVLCPGQAAFTVLRKTLELQFGEVTKASAFTPLDTCE
jgi:hypothetical protein